MIGLKIKTFRTIKKKIPLKEQRNQIPELFPVNDHKFLIV